MPLTFAGVTPDGPYGYRGPVPTRHLTVDPAGAFEAEFAWLAYASAALRNGTLPLWNPYQGLGQPFLSNYVSGVLYPINWLALVLAPAWWD